MKTVIHSYPVWLPQTQTWMYTQYLNLPTDRIDAHVVCDQTENSDQFAITNLHSLGGRQSWRFWREKVLRKMSLRLSATFLERRGRDLHSELVHSHFGDIGWRDLTATTRIPARHIVTFYGYDVGKLPQNSIWRQRYLELFAAVDMVLCEGPHMGDALIALGCSARKVRVQHLGIEVGRIPFKPRRWVPTMPLRVLIASSFVEKKGIPFALAALARLKREVNLEITLIGGARSDIGSQREKQRILDAIETAGIEDRVRFMGYLPHSKIFEQAYRSDIFVAASVTASDGDTEGGAPVILSEMAATGIPIISTRHCDIPHVLGCGYSQLLSDERDVDALTDNLRWLVKHSDEWSPILSSTRRRIEAEFDGRIQGARLAQLYEDVIDRRIARSAKSQGRDKCQS